MMKGNQQEYSIWLGMSAADIVDQFGGDYSIDAFADSKTQDALPVIIPAYNKDHVENARLPWTLASLACASRIGGVPVRPLVVINGPGDGQIPRICTSFGLSETQCVQYEFSGKMRALKAGVKLLLEQTGHVGTFATTDDDAIIPVSWPHTVMRHMDQAPSNSHAVSGGSIRYYGVDEVRRSVLALRNAGNALKEMKAHKANTVRAHGNNQWLKADIHGVMAETFAAINPNIGYGDDAAIVDAVRSSGGQVLAINLNRRGEIAVAGNRTKSMRELVNSAIRSSDRRYVNDPLWQGTDSYKSN